MLFLTLAAAALATPPLKQAQVVALHGPSIHVEDVVDLRGIHPARRQRIGALVIARLPHGVRAITFSHEAVAGLVRRAAPGLQPRLSRGEMRFIDQSAVVRRRSACTELTRSVAKGGTLSPQDLVSSDCVSADNAGLRFEPHNNIVRASRNLNAGEKLGRLVVQPPPEVEAGSELTMVTRAGPVRIERRVVALQTGRSGRRLFVRDRDGNVTGVLLDGRAGVEGR